MAPPSTIQRIPLPGPDVILVPIFISHVSNNLFSYSNIFNHVIYKSSKKSSFQCNKTIIRENVYVYIKIKFEFKFIELKIINMIIDVQLFLYDHN